MKVKELIDKVKSLTVEEINAIVSQGIEIEDIEYLLINEDNTRTEILFENKNLKQLLLKKLNLYIVTLLEDIKNNPEKELSEDIKNIIEIYFKKYFEDSLEVDIGSDIGRKIISTIFELKKSNIVILDLCKQNQIVEKYFKIIRKKSNEEMSLMSKEDALGYDKTFEQFFEITILGSNIPEAEAALRIAQREDIDISQHMALDIYCLCYRNGKNNPKTMQGDKVFSIILEYETQLRNRGVQKELAYSPIKEMEQAIIEGRFGVNNILSKEEFAYVFFIAQNRNILDSEIKGKLDEILSEEELEVNIGDRECKRFLLDNKEEVIQLLNTYPRLEYKIIKPINLYVMRIFREINKNPKKEISVEEQEICRNYFEYYFEYVLDQYAVNDIGIELIKTIELAERNSFIKRLVQKYEIKKRYREAISWEFPEDVTQLSEEEIKRYDQIFLFLLNRRKIGNSNEEAEMALKMAQRSDVQELRSLDYFAQIYQLAKNDFTNGKQKMDEMFSIILDYEILLKSKNVEDNGLYSPIKEMTQSIKDGTFSKDNKLSKEEFAFSMKMLQHPEILDDDTNQKLCEILRTAYMNLEIGKREILYLLENTEVFNKITEGLPTLKTNILKQIDIYIYSILNEISNKQREITPQERMICSRYFKNYFGKSLENNFATKELTQLCFLVVDLANPNCVCNIRGLKNQEETIEFFKDEYEENQIWEKFDAKLLEEIKKIKMNQNISIQEFQIYDNMFLEYSYRVEMDDVDNIEIIRVLNEQAKKIKIPSRTIENEIERYIHECLNNEGEYNNPDFYEIVLDYYERQLESSAADINNNAAISHLIRAAQIGRLPENITTRVLEKLEERKQKNPIPQITDTEDLETYMHNVAEIRLHQGRMPMESCEFIIKQAILNQKGMIKHFRMIQRALEDFTEYQLEISGLTNYFVAVEEQPFLKKKTYAGLHNSVIKRIMISKLKLSLMGSYRILETALHEHTHAEDDDQIENGQLNGIRYKMLKENIIGKHKPSFYYDNYQYMFCEINARIKGYMKRIKVLRTWGLTDAEIAKLQEDNIQTKVKEYCEECREGKTKKIGDVSKDVNVMFFELLQENQGLLDEYPALRMEFEVKGANIQRKSFVNMLQEFEHLLSQTEGQKEVARISNLYSEILLNGGEVEEERKEDEIEQLIAFKSENPIIMAYRDKVIKVKFTSQMAMVATMKNCYKGFSAEERERVWSEGTDQRINNNQKDIGTGENNGNSGGEYGSTIEK